MDIAIAPTVFRASTPSGAPAAEQQPPSEPQDSFVYQASRAVAGGVSAVGGGLAGFSLGSVRGALSHDCQLSESQRSAVRTLGAVAVTALGVAASVGAFSALGGVAGPVGVAVSLLAGPTIGSALGNGLAGAAEGTAAALKGGFKGMITGFKNGLEAGRSVVDWIAGKDKTEKAAAEPPAAAEPSAREAVEPPPEDAPAAASNAEDVWPGSAEGGADLHHLFPRDEAPAEEFNLAR